MPDSKIDFSWPSLKQLSEMPSYVTLKQIDLEKGKENRGSGNFPLYSVRCALSNHVESPMFKSAGNSTQSGCEIDF